MPKPLISILGPTASGKSGLALELAKEFNGEIVSCDSMQVYQKMDIGTATPSAEELHEVPHHLVNIFEIDQAYDVQQFLNLAKQAIDDIHSRGKIPFLTGGTGLYARILLYGADLLASDKELAKQIRREYEEQGLEALIKELALTDPETAERVAANPRHVMRALEVIRLTGKKIPHKSSWQSEVLYPGHQFILIPDAEYSRERIRKRCGEMLKEGWIEETESLVKQGLLESPTAIQSLGYRDIAQYLDGTFEGDFSVLQERLSTLTSRYAKRQRTWFRNQHPGAQVFNYKKADEFKQVAQNIRQILKDSLG